MSGCWHSTACAYQGSDTMHMIYYQGHWLCVHCSKKMDGSEIEMLSIRYMGSHGDVSHARWDTMGRACGT